MTARYFGLVPAAGSGARFGNAGPKQYSPLAGKPMLHHSIARLLAAPEVEIVFVVLPLADREFREHDWSAFGERSEEHTSELQSLTNLVCRLLLEKKKKYHTQRVQ